MEHSDFLLTTAEIAIAFAAFGSLISILGNRGSTIAQQIAAGRLVSIVLLGLLTVALCLLPFVGLSLGMAEASSYRLSSSVVLGPELAGTIYLIRRAPREIYEERFTTVVMFVLAAVAGLLLLLIAIGLGGGRVSGLYLATVVLHLVGAGQFFLLIVVSYAFPRSS